MKKILSIVFALLIICSSSMAVFAMNNGMEFELSDDGTYYTLIKCNSSDKTIVIPKEYNGLPVRGVGDQTLDAETADDKWDIPFYDSKDTVEDIILTDEVFFLQLYSCPVKHKNLKFNEFANGLYLGTSDNPYYALIGTELPKGTEQLVLHPNTEIIGAYAAGSLNLKYITLSDSLKYIHRSAFHVYTQYGDQKCHIVYAVYGGGYYLGTADNPYYAFAGVVNPDSTIIELNKDTKLIMPNALYCKDSQEYADRLESITIPKSVETVSENAFYGCDSLKTINLAAESIENLKFCKLPDNITANWNYGNGTNEDNSSKAESDASTLDNAENDGKGNIILILAVIAGVIVGGSLALYKSKKKK